MKNGPNIITAFALLAAFGMGGTLGWMVSELPIFNDPPEPVEEERDTSADVGRRINTFPPYVQPPGRPEVPSRSWIDPEIGARVNNQTFMRGSYLTKPEGVPYCPGPWSPEDPSGERNPYPPGGPYD